MLNVTISIEGKTLSDVELAIDEAKKRIVAGNYMGADSNEDGEFSFQVTGEEEESYQCGSCENAFVELEDNTCPHCGSGNWVKGSIDI